MRLLKMFRPLERQVKAYIAGKEGRYPDAARRDERYLGMFLKVTDAWDVTEVGPEDFKRLTEYVDRTYKWPYYTDEAVKALRCFLRNYRAQGFPTLVPREVRKLCRA